MAISVKYWLFIFFRVEENEPKEDARVPRCFALPCASPLRPEHAETRPPSADSDSPRAFSGHIVDARRETMGR